VRVAVGIAQEPGGGAPLPAQHRAGRAEGVEVAAVPIDDQRLDCTGTVSGG
jgi:hypothetical protein